MTDFPHTAEQYNPIEVVANPYNLDALRYDEPYFDATRNKWILITPDRVRGFVDQINGLDTSDHRHFTIVIGAGGTPTMLPTGFWNSLEPTFNTAELMTKTDPDIHQEFQIATFDAFITDSSQLDIDDAGDLAMAMHYIWQHMKPQLRAQFTGFGVIHGSDTMDESSNHLGMMMGRHQPFNIVHTGTEKSTLEDPYELWRNLRYLVYTLETLYENRKADNLTVFGEKLLLTAGLVYGEQGMGTPIHRPVTEIERVLDPGSCQLPSWLRKDMDGWEGSDPLVVYRGDNRIGILPAQMAENRRYIEVMIRDVGYAAILLITHHSGTYDAKVMQQMSDLIEKEHHEIPLFGINPVLSEAKPRLDSYAASAKWMLDLNVQPLDMTIEAAQAKLMRLLSAPGRESRLHPNYTPGYYDEYKSWGRLKESWVDRLVRIRKEMTTNYLGEIPNDQNRRPRKAR